MENLSDQNAPQTQEPQKQKFFVGMILILVLAGIGFVSSLAGLRKPMTIIGPFFVSGAIAVIYDLVWATLLGVVFYGILKRKFWARKLTIIWQALSIFTMSAMFVSFLANKERFVEFYRDLVPGNENLFSENTIMISMLPGLVFSWVIGIVIIIYVYRKKSFFTN